jgi:hypothetical protein
LVVIGLISWQWIFIPATLAIWSSSNTASYGPGTTLHGVRWFGGYSELNLKITNSSEHDYDNFTADLTTDQRIQDLKQTAGLTKCTTESDLPWGLPTVQHFENGKPSGPAGEGGVVVGGEPQEYLAVPQGEDGHVVGRVAGFKIRCDRILANDTVEFYGAIFNLETDAPPYGPSQPAKWVTLIADFQTGSHNRTRCLRRCEIMTSCSTDTISASVPWFEQPFTWLWTRTSQRLF